MRIYSCGCTEYREDETAAHRADGTDLMVESSGPCPAHRQLHALSAATAGYVRLCACHRPAPERHEQPHLFTPAPAVMPGQLGLGS